MSHMQVDIESLRKHIGRKHVDDDVATQAPLAALATIFERPEGAPKPGDPVPPGAHWTYFWRMSKPTALGGDGLPVADEVLPPMPFPRRMFAGNNIVFHAPLRVGDAIRRETELTDISLRKGDTGQLIFTVQTQRIYGPKGLALTDERHGVFREEVPAGAKSGIPKRDTPPADLPWRRTITVNDVSLFRYSAITFNPHRIHYDRPYAVEVEGYPGLVVHGPYAQQCLLNLAVDSNPGRELATFNMRARAPLFDTGPFSVVGRATGEKACELWTVTPEGTIAASATATFA
jgi:3-methylfumaryl-CoA hydratase